MIYLYLYLSLIVVAWLISNAVIGFLDLNQKEYPQPLVMVVSIFWPALLVYIFIYLLSLSLLKIGQTILNVSEWTQKFGKSFRKEI